MCMHVLSHFSTVRLFATPWTVANQAPLSMEFSRQEYWSGLLFPSPGDFTNPGIEPVSPMPPAVAGEFFITEPPGKVPGGRCEIKELHHKEEENGHIRRQGLRRTQGWGWRKPATSQLVMHQDQKAALLAGSEMI